ncbi:MAG: DoxX family protein [Myxococcales bacterium FL481]|nr:MAG: DoxX family protein [Myxococcales bacterium FL481]
MAVDVDSRWRDIGLLWLRVGLGAMYVVHGWPKLEGGGETWAQLGQAMRHIGVRVYPELWGFAAAMAEFGGGILLALGVMFRPAAGALAATMIVAATMHLRSGDGLAGAAHAIEAGIVFVALICLGPGRFVVGRRRRSP